MQDNQVLIERTGASDIITLNRAEKKNALTRAMYEDLEKMLQASESDQQVRSVIIRGADQCFTAGNDLKDFMATELESDSAVLRLLRILANFKKPLIASVEGCAIGIGTTLLLHCDFVFADKEAYFQTPFISLGLCPEGASSLLLPSVIGYQRAAKMLLLAEKVSADEAKDMGLVLDVADESSAFELATACAERINQLPPTAMRASKALLKQHDVQDVLAAIDREAQQFAQCLQSEEAQEAFKAFFERRAPDWTRF